jgi:hypothetical protein
LTIFFLTILFCIGGCITRGVTVIIAIPLRLSLHGDILKKEKKKKDEPVCKWKFLILILNTATKNDPYIFSYTFRLYIFASHHGKRYSKQKTQALCCQ